MSSTLIEIEQQAVRLSQEQRAQLALFLIQSLESTNDGDVADAWRVEAEARLEQIERGESLPIPGDEVFTKIRRRFA